MEITNEKIFAVVFFPDNEKQKLLYKSNINEIIKLFERIDTRNEGFLCINFHNVDKVPFENTVLYYPEIENNSFILSKKSLKEICGIDPPEGIVAFLKNIYNQYENNQQLDKEEFKKKIDSIKFIPSMTEEEAIKYIENIPNLTLDEWIDTLPDSLYISNYSIGRPVPEIEIQSKIFNELLSHFFTAELVYAIADEFNEIKINTDNVSYPEITEFKDIKEKIKGNEELMRFYEAYHMLKCLCFILHDKPVDELAPVLINTFEERMVKTNETKNLIDIFKKGFNINQSNSVKVTQTRCHNTLTELTNKFNMIMNGKNIIVPDNDKAFSVPYSAFKLERKGNIQANDESYNIFKEINEILNIYTYGLGDAVGNNQFINNICNNDKCKISIYSDTLAQQDAAGITHSNNEIEVIENEQQYIIKDMQGSVIKTFNIEPLRFLDVSIICEKINNNNVFLYYANNINYEQDNYNEIKTTIPEKFYKLQDNGFEKTLIAIARGKVSQNDTVFLLDGIVDISKSLRGKGKIYKNENIWTLTTPDEEKNKTIKILMASLLKEAGDQSKIQVIENLSRNSMKSYVATVDSFFSDSFINGGVLFKGGNVEIYIPQGFQQPTVEEIKTTIRLLKMMEIFTYAELSTIIKKFSDNIINILETILKDETVFVKLPYTSVLSFTAMINVLKNTENFISKAKFNEIYNGGKFDINIHSGINNEVSLFRRLINFDKISKLFILLEDEINKEFKEELGTLISNFFKGVELVEDVETKKNVKIFIEQMPLFYLIRNISVIETHTFTKPKVGRKDSVQITYVNELLKEVLSSKLINFCKEYGLNYIDFLKKHGIKSIVEEDRFNDVKRSFSTPEISFIGKRKRSSTIRIRKYKSSQNVKSKKQRISESQGSESPSQGSESPSQGSESPSQGSESRSQGTISPSQIFIEDNNETENKRSLTQNNSPQEYLTKKIRTEGGRKTPPSQNKTKKNRRPSFSQRKPKILQQ
jgi:hypothetical protein